MNPFVALASLPLRLKLALGLIAAIILAIALSIFSVNQFNQALQPASGAVVQVLARERAASLLAFVDRTTATLAGLFNDPGVVNAAAALTGDANNSPARQTLETAFHNVLNANPTFEQVQFVSLTGDMLAAVPSTIPGSNDVSQAYIQALRNSPPAQRPDDVYLDLFGSQTGSLLPVAAVIGKNGKSTGFLVGVIDMTGSAASAQPSIHSVLKRGMAPSANIVDFFLIDKNGNVYSPDIQPALRTKASKDTTTALTSRVLLSTVNYVSPVQLGDALGFGVPIDQLNATLIAESQLFRLSTRAESGQFLLQLLGILLAAVVVMIVIGIYLETTVAAPTRRLLRLATSFARGDAPERIPPLRQHDELGNLYNAVGQLTLQVRQDIEGLENRVAQRTRDVEATRDIGQIISSIRDLDMLLRQVVELIRERFENVYHAQIFLADASGEYAVLRVSTGEAGKQLLARGHRLAVGSQSVIGQVMAAGQPVVALDIATSPIHKVNELLPDTRAEIALPLRTREGIIGALDLQSKHTEAFSAADINLFQSIADQLTIAITNARLFEELNSRVNEIETLNRQLTREAWNKYIRTRRRSLLAVSTRDGEEADWSDMQLQALDTQQLAEQTRNGIVTVAVPVSLRGEVLGVVEWDIPEGSYTEDARRLTRDLADRLAVSADNARLFEQVQRLAEREAFVNAIANQLTQQSDVAQILRTAVREVGQALHVPQTAIRLAVSQPDEAGKPTP